MVTPSSAVHDLEYAEVRQTNVERIAAMEEIAGWRNLQIGTKDIESAKTSALRRTEHYPLTGETSAEVGRYPTKYRKFGKEILFGLIFFRFSKEAT